MKPPPARAPDGTPPVAASSGAPTNDRGTAHRAREWLIGLGLLVVTVLAYLPLWRAGFIWDDDGHVTPAALRSLRGLFRVWFEPGATQQYYPALHSLFWLEHRLWGDGPLGYHLANLALHTAAAWLFYRTLRRLAVPGAALAAALFAIHPVGVETVAWVSEQKNTLSAVCYFGAALAYLRYREERSAGRYLGATLLFLAALLSKSVTATLPAALLVVAWWRDGRLGWRRDVAPLLPWFTLAALAGTMTVWVERTFIGASGDAFSLSVAERALIAGRAVWFYAGNLLAPLELTFIYPRWQLDALSPAQWLWPASALFALAGLWRVRRRSRGPLAVALLFAGTLFPALGCFNVYPFVYSFVADHFQYLASAMLLAGLAAGLAGAAHRFAVGRPGLTVAFAAGTVALLAVLTFRQAGTYVSEERLWQTTLARNPACWMACDHLGKLRLQEGRVDDAEGYFQQALRLHPGDASAHNSLGVLALDAGRNDAAIAHFEAAVGARPRGVEARNNLGLALLRSGRPDRAIAELERVLELKERYAAAHFNLGAALAQAGRGSEAAGHFARAAALEPNDAVMQTQLATVQAQAGRFDEAMAGYERAIALGDHAPAHLHLGNLWLRRGATDRAIAAYRRCLELEPGATAARTNLAHVLFETGSIDEAVTEFERALALEPANAELNNDLGAVRLQQGRVDEAVVRFEAALAAQPDYAAAHVNLANVLLQRQQPAAAVPHFRQALAADGRDARLHNHLGLALLLSGDTPAAIAAFQQALAIDPGYASAQQNLQRAQSGQ